MSPRPDPRERYRTCLDAHGNPIRLTAGRWHGQRSYDSAWETCGALADNLCVNELVEDPAKEPFLVWDPQAAPGSGMEQRMLLGMQMTVAATALRHLAAATVLVCAPDLCRFDLVWPDALAAGGYAAQAELPADPLYLDFTTADRRNSVAVSIGGEVWPLTGALVWRAGGCLLVVPFSADPADPGGPAGQPIGRIIYGPAGRVPRPNPGDVVIDVANALPMTPAVTDPSSRVTVRLHAALELAQSALSVVAQLAADDVTVGPAHVTRQVRRQAQRQAEHVVWTASRSVQLAV